MRVNDFDKFLSEGIFKWEDFADTDLSGPGWDAKAMDFMTEFKKDLDKELSGKSASKIERKSAVNALLILLKQQADEIKKDIDAHG